MDLCIKQLERVARSPFAVSLVKFVVHEVSSDCGHGEPLLARLIGHAVAKVIVLDPCNGSLPLQARKAHSAQILNTLSR